eukprot:GHVL01019107.1.p1 GENE.GHVL01019107.1~~GHVL01019107.1.p1  ORF type:complete len:215 (+),score=41.43 GHVL01019107.1:352-996(+)
MQVSETVQKPTNDISVKVIGHIRSCFPEKYAVPRQGALVPSSRAVFELASYVDEDCLDSIDDFGWVWIVFIFHLSGIESRRAFRSPPKLSGEKRGVLSTRSPHRPSPIGLSACKLIKRRGKRLILGGVDIVDDTPVIDIKPYHSLDAVKDPRIPDWLKNQVETTPKKTDVPISVIKDLQLYVDDYRSNKIKELSTKEGGVKPFRFFSTHEEFIQ